MRITDNRSELDTALKKPENTFLLLFGKDNKLADSIHDEAEGSIGQKYRKTALIENIALLTQEERQAWYKADDQYTTLTEVKQKGKARQVVEQATLTDLCEPLNQPAADKIENAFARADLI